MVALLALDMGGAARDLARNVAAAVAHDAVVLTVRNLSTLGAGEVAEIRRAFEPELRTGGATEVRLTISENLTQFLLVAEIHRGGEREVLLESWPRTASPSRTGPKGAAAEVRLVKRLLWEQAQPILDVAVLDDGILVLDGERVLLAHGADQQSVPIPALHPWPRDMRGRLAVNPPTFTAWLPGTVCRGSVAAPISIDCRESQEPWPLAPGAQAALTPVRNYFEGRVEIAAWGAREVPAFYAAAPAGDAWIFAGVEGRAHIYTRDWEPSGSIEQWGSDVAGVETPCGPRILATRPASLAEPDAIQPYELIDGAAQPAGAALEFAGPITALWSAGNSATAVSRDLETGRYAAFSLAPACGS